jgi:hypothetical protein
MFVYISTQEKKLQKFFFEKDKLPRSILPGRIPSDSDEIQVEIRLKGLLDLGFIRWYFPCIVLSFYLQFLLKKLFLKTLSMFISLLLVSQCSFNLFSVVVNCFLRSTTLALAALALWITFLKFFGEFLRFFDLNIEIY